MWKYDWSVFDKNFVPLKALMCYWKTSRYDFQNLMNNFVSRCNQSFRQGIYIRAYPDHIHLIVDTFEMYDFLLTTFLSMHFPNHDKGFWWKHTQNIEKLLDLFFIANIISNLKVNQKKKLLLVVFHKYFMIFYYILFLLCFFFCLHSINFSMIFVGFFYTFWYRISSLL